MKYFLTIRGHAFEVELGAARDGRVVARLDGVEHLLELRPIDGLARCAVAVDDTVHDVVFDPAPAAGAGDAGAPSMSVTLGGTRHVATIEDERERAAHLTAGAVAKGPVTVRAVMPGILRAVLVKAGEVVAAGQPLAILEAMKMENEIRAEHAGVVREVRLAAGTAVDKDAPLVVIDPPPVPRS